MENDIVFTNEMQQARFITLPVFLPSIRIFSFCKKCFRCRDYQAERQTKRKVLFLLLQGAEPEHPNLDHVLLLAAVIPGLTMIYISKDIVLLITFMRTDPFVEPFFLDLI